jgi:ABC-type amino acid transport system permease subunit
VQPPTSPIIVRVIGPPTNTVTLGDVILQAIGLTGVITLIALVLGLVLGGLFILIRIRRPDNAFNGETSGELSLHLSD